MCKCTWLNIQRLKMRRRSKIDANQKQITTQLRKIDCKVAITSMLGKGYPDLLVAYNLRLFWIELKDGTKPPSQRKLTPDEEKFHQEWQGYVYVCESLDDILKIIL